jgi:hypothetical protein
MLNLGMAQHDHPFQPMVNSMHILYTANKGRPLNTVENLYIHRETVTNNQLNERMTTKPIIIMNVILHHTQPLNITRNTTVWTPTKT